MDHERIEKIVREVNEKAKLGSPSTAKSTLAKVVADHFKKREITAKTVERMFSRYLENDLSVGEPHPETINVLCKFLGYEDYRDYVKENYFKKKKKKEKDEVIEADQPKKNTSLIDKNMFILLTLVGAISAIIFTIISRPDREKCMMWSDNQFVEIDCNWHGEINNGNIIQNFDNSIFKNLKKIEVTINTPFYSPKKKEPRVWYTMNNNDEIEYFSAPGKHPITGMKLVPITDSIIDEYVINKKPAVLNPSVKNNPNTIDLAVLIFNGQKLDYEIGTKLQNGPLKGYKVTPYLIIASKLDQELKSELLTGNLNTLGKGLSKHVDELCIGTISYSYRESGKDIKRYTCEISLNYDLFLADGSRQTQGAFSKQVSSIGFSKDQAKQNALRELTE